MGAIGAVLLVACANIAEDSRFKRECHVESAAALLLLIALNVFLVVRAKVLHQILVWQQRGPALVRRPK
jgi:hypothetical protein